MVSAPLTTTSQASSIHPFSDWPASPVPTTTAATDAARGPPAPLQRAISTPNGSLTNNSSISTPPAPVSVRKMHHPVDVHNLLRREKMPKKVKAHFEAMLDDAHLNVGKAYQKEFSKLFKLTELHQMYRDYATDHQRQLDQASFLMNHRSMSIVGSIDMQGVRHVARHDKHAKTMYDEAFILDTVFGADDDITGFEGPGFDLIHELERKARKPRRGLTRSKSYLEHISQSFNANNPMDEGDLGGIIAEPDYAHDDKQTISEEMAKIVKKMHKHELEEEQKQNELHQHGHGHVQGLHGHGHGEGLHEESMGQKMFRKHSEFSRDMHLKIATEAIDKHRHHSYVPPSKTIIEKEKSRNVEEK